MFVCACVSQKGGAGKTTLVLHLAVAAQRAGHTAVIIDIDPQGTAEAWGGWRQDAPPVVLSAKASNLIKTLDRAREAGAAIAFIDTPPLAQGDASTAARAADLVLIPCRPRAFDLHAIRLTASLIEMTRKPAFAVFNGGHPATIRGYDEPAEIVATLGLQVAPVRLADRAPYHQATMTGQAAQEIEPDGRAAEEVQALWLWLCQHSGMRARTHTGTQTQAGDLKHTGTRAHRRGATSPGAPTRPSLAHPSLAHPSLAHPSLAHPSLAHPSLAHPSLARP